VNDVISRASFDSVLNRCSVSLFALATHHALVLGCCTSLAHAYLFILSVPHALSSPAPSAHTRFPRRYSTSSRMLDDPKGHDEDTLVYAQCIAGCSHACMRGRRPVDGGTRLPRRPSRPRRDAAELSAARTVLGRRDNVRSCTHVQFLFGGKRRCRFV
jgi:hypothetical protein